MDRHDNYFYIVKQSVPLSAFPPLDKTWSNMLYLFNFTESKRVKIKLETKDLVKTKTKIEVKQIEDKDIDVSINSEEHLIGEIKTEIKECFACGNYPCNCEVFDMWEE